MKKAVHWASCTVISLVTVETTLVIRAYGKAAGNNSLFVLPILRPFILKTLILFSRISKLVRKIIGCPFSCLLFKRFSKILLHTCRSKLYFSCSSGECRKVLSGKHCLTLKMLELIPYTHSGSSGLFKRHQTPWESASISRKIKVGLTLADLSAAYATRT